MNGEEGAHFRFRILRRRLVIFAPMAENTVAGLQAGEVERMVCAWIDREIELRAGTMGCATISRQAAAGVQSSASPIRIRVGALTTAE